MPQVVSLLDLLEGSSCSVPGPRGDESEERSFEARAFGLAVLAGCQGQTPGAGGEKAAVPAVASVSVERGEYLVKTSGCNDCHTPWVMGPTGRRPT